MLTKRNTSKDIIIQHIINSNNSSIMICPSTYKFDSCMVDTTHLSLTCNKILERQMSIIEETNRQKNKCVILCYNPDLVKHLLICSNYYKYKHIIYENCTKKKN